MEKNFRTKHIQNLSYLLGSEVVLYIEQSLVDQADFTAHI